MALPIIYQLFPGGYYVTQLLSPEKTLISEFELP